MAFSFRSVCSGTGMLANTALSQNLEEALFFFFKKKKPAF